MDLDRVAAVIRPRTYPEAIDLGFRMVRAWWRPIAGAWVVLGLPFLAIVAGGLYRHPGLAFVLIWWVKPLFDRVPVFVLSRGLFGSLPGVGETLRAWPGLARRDLVAALTWRRFDPVRSLRMPAWLLEGQRGRERRRRFGVLARDVRFDAALLTVTCAVFELCVFCGITALLLSFGLPPEVEAAFGGDAAPSLPLGYRWALVGCWVAAAALIEPFYVAGGFALYVNRRTHLEGWDIEVAFRRMTARIEASRATALVLFAALSAGALVPHAVAQDGAPVAAEVDRDPRQVIDAVLADPVFGSEQTETYWKLRETRKRDRRGLDGALGNLLGQLSRWTAAVLAAVATIWLAIHLARRRRARRTADAPPRDEPPPGRVLGLDVREESLPEDVAGAARSLWDAGRRREAMRLLYRGALSWLIAREGLPLKASATEGDCLRLAAQRVAPSRLSYFRSLTEAWIAVAYAHREPDDDAGAGLIRDWTGHFGSAPGGS